MIFGLRKRDYVLKVIQVRNTNLAVQRFNFSGVTEVWASGGIRDFLCHVLHYFHQKCTCVPGYDELTLLRCKTLGVCAHPF